LLEPKYGYALIDELSRHGLEIEQGTLYPLLRRLEEQGLLESEWNVEGSRPRRYYVISPAGRELLRLLQEDWSQLVQVIDILLVDLKGESHGTH
jgi:PadR family transcriptional regulator PadR